MKYSFYQFTLDDKKQTLHYQGSDGDFKEIEITKINYQVLLFFIQHRSKVVTKDQIIESVWQGKMVTDNSIDQSISKIRKSLAQFDERVIIRTAYGKGLEFAPEVTFSAVQDSFQTLPNERSANIAVIWIGLVVVAGFLLWYFSSYLINEPKAKNPATVMWLSNENSIDDWLDQSSHQLLSQVFGHSNKNYLLDDTEKPQQLNNKEFIENYWRINPALEVIQTGLQQHGDTYTLDLKVATLAGTVAQSFSGSDLLYILNVANQWLLENSGMSEQKNQPDTLLPEDPHVLELYLRSLYTYQQGELDQALNYVQLAIDQEPDFYLGQLQLAELHFSKGNNEKSLNILDQLQKTPIYRQLEIAEQSLRGSISDRIGNEQQAVEIYLQLLNKYPEEADGKLLPVKFDLSFTLSSLQRYDEALLVLDEIITALENQFDLDLKADAWHKKGSILLQIGQTAAAKKAADLAYQHFNDLSDLFNVGKVNILNARIANHESNYQQATDYLQQAIGIYRHVDYPVGVGATLNELIYTLMVSGRFTEAWTQMNELRQIALDIDYFAMLMAAKQFEIEISRARKQWVQAEASLAEYFRLATEKNFARGILKHQLFELDLALDQSQADRAQLIIDSIQDHIESSGEARLQPRLNIQQAKVYFLQNQSQAGIDLLHKTKAMALLTEDVESSHNINNELLQHYLDLGNISMAENIVKTVDTAESQPLAYPYLLLNSKTQLALGNQSKAAELAQQCKRQANEFWRPADEMYLVGLTTD